ncbi:hypothetical protein Pcac1_g16063 [Phytophthora cactorum]|nr:hypothetical protein Pcac1_g16063 [Phytophthora cactorum]
MFLGSCSRLIAAATGLALALTSSLVLAEELCSIVPSSYTQAKTDHPDLSKALEALEQHAIASWFTDRMTTDERSTMITNMLNQCSEDTRLSIVVYGIPNKDCDAGLSSGGSVKSTDDYKAFLKQLTDAVGDRKVLYVVEPDAVGLLAKENSCGSSAGYFDNLKVAVEALSANANAELYVDVGYWMLADSTNAGKIAPIMQELGSCGRVKGVTINTSNYRSNDECAAYCTNFQNAMGKSDMSCVVDTSRNFKGSPTSDWCNVPTAGIGKPPSSETGFSNIDYFMWIKPPGESDGECATGGTSAGSFYADGFTKLWDQGYFVREGGMKTIADGTGDATQQSSQASAGSSVDQTSSIDQGKSGAGTIAPQDTGSYQSSTPTTAPADTGTSQNYEGTPAPTQAPTQAPSEPPSTTLVAEECLAFWKQSAVHIDIASSKLIHHHQRLHAPQRHLTEDVALRTDVREADRVESSGTGHCFRVVRRDSTKSDERLHLGVAAGVPQDGLARSAHSDSAHQMALAPMLPIAADPSPPDQPLLGASPAA